MGGHGEADALEIAAASILRLRGGAALVIAGLMAEGRTILSGVEHIDRGYETLQEGICTLGGVIERRTT